MGTELGAALKSWRRQATTAPPASATGSRRVPGLRREEVAAAAGVSFDYLVRLEQGRATRPSVPVLFGLARALGLSPMQREHLFGLAGQPSPSDLAMPAVLSPSAQRLVERMGSMPVAVYDPAWTLLDANGAWTSLMGTSPAQVEQPNLLLGYFRRYPQGARPSDEQTRRWELALITDLRSAARRYPADPSLTQLLADLRETGPLFEELWDSQLVADHSSHRKVFVHPKAGPVEFDCDVIQPTDADLRIVVFSAPPGAANQPTSETDSDQPGVLI